MIYSSDNIRVPQPVKWGVAFLVFGVIFPIYGTPEGFLGLPRLTFFRLGLVVLLFDAIVYRVSLLSVVGQAPVALLCFLMVLRIASLLFTSCESFYAGATQIWWYSQGLLCLVLILSFVRRWPYLKQYLYLLIVLFGAIAALLTSYQFVEFIVSKNVFALPFSMTKYGVENRIYSGWYPLGPGGRAMGPFFDSNMTGSFMLLLICLLLPSISLKSVKQSLKPLFVIIISFVALVGSGSRHSFVIFGLVSYIYLFMILGRNHWRLRGLNRMMFTIMLSLVVIQGYRYLSSSELPSNAVSVFDRLELGIQRGDIGATRIASSKRLLSSLDCRTLLLGAGEGSGWWSSHNAFLIVMYENGLWAVVVLFSAGYLMLIKTFKDASRSIKLKLHDPVAVAKPLIVLSWMLMLAMNWAQLNQSFPWIFIALVLMPPGWVAKRKSRVLVKRQAVRLNSI